MKCKSIVLVAVALTFRAYSQGYLALDNNQNTSTSPTATANGLFWLSTGGGAPVLIDQDFNATFYAGARSDNMSLLNTSLANYRTAVGDDGLDPGMLSHLS